MISGTTNYIDVERNFTLAKMKSMIVHLLIEKSLLDPNNDIKIVFKENNDESKILNQFAYYLETLGFTNTTHDIMVVIIQQLRFIIFSNLMLNMDVVEARTGNLVKSSYSLLPITQYRYGKLISQKNFMIYLNKRRSFIIIYKEHLKSNECNFEFDSSNLDNDQYLETDLSNFAKRRQIGYKFNSSQLKSLRNHIIIDILANEYSDNICVCFGDGSIFIIDINTGKIIGNFLMEDIIDKLDNNQIINIIHQMSVRGDMIIKCIECQEIIRGRTSIIIYVFIYDIKLKTIKKLSYNLSNYVLCCILSHNGTQLLLILDNHSVVRLFLDENQKFVLIENLKDITSIKYLDDEHFITNSSDRCIKLWKNDICVYEFREARDVNFIYSSDCSLLLSIDQNGRLTVYDLYRLNLLYQISTGYVDINENIFF